MTGAVHVLGVRHHGPGSGRAVATALAEVRPDCVLIEGPPELDAVAALAARVVPPAAALVYVPDRPRRASFYPFASWSPEWLALRWALARGVTAGFCDLPAAHALAPWPRRRRGPAVAPDAPGVGPLPEAGAGDPDDEDADAGPDDADDADGAPGPAGPDPRTLARLDPIGALAAAAGFDDPERWWDDVIEHRAHGLDVFAVVLDAMRELRAAAGADDALPDADHRNLRREAAMRRVIRQRMKDHERVVVVCGVWHAPALVPEAHPTAAADAALLRGLPKVKVAATWIPWTAARLARASGYGAGVAAPGWYDHLFTVPDDEVVVRWLVRTARALREERVDVPPASVIDAVRLAESLAVLRGRPLAGLSELREATVAALCGGNEGPLRLVDAGLLVGDAMGAVPDDTPMVPLARDLDAERRRLRLPATATARHLELDLRQPRHVERSTLLHRLLVLDVPWGDPLDVGRTTGTFKERWRLEWRPELDVALIEAGGAGTTIVEAAGATLRARAVDADVPALTRLVEGALVADLPEALDAVMAMLAAATARLHDTVVLMGAVEPLARVVRYGDVRAVDTAAVHAVLDTIVTRIAVGLPAACAALDDDAAEAMLGAVDATQRGVGTVGDATLMTRWMAALGVISRQEGVHGLVAGRATRLRLDAGLVAATDAAAGLSRALSVGGDPRRGAGWVEGFLAGDMALLLHDPVLLGVLDEWVAATPGFVFDDVLPLLRRTFSTFAPAERKLLGAHLRRAAEGAAVARGGDDVDAARGATALPLVLRLLGVDADPGDDAVSEADDERLRRWRLVLGGGEAEGTGVDLAGGDARRDATLAALYEGERRAGLARSAPQVARWLGDIRTLFPTSVVQVMQRDAIDRLGLRRLLLEPELLREVTPDVHLAATLVALGNVVPERSRDAAREIVRRVVDDVQRRLAPPVRQAVSGALRRSLRTRRPRPGDVDWNRTVAANLRHYQPEHRTVIPERLVGFGRRSPQVQREIVLCLDQSGSMIGSVVHAGVLGAVLASLPSLRTRVIAFGTEVVDLTALVADPVDLLFGVQLGGGTDIAQALAWCASVITRPAQTILVLVSDLYEGGDRDDLVRRAAQLVASGVVVVALLALSDEGAPVYDHEMAERFAALGIPAFACTPDQFPDLMAAAVDHRDLGAWAGEQQVPLAAPVVHR